MKKKRAVAADGSTLLHQVERRLHQLLHQVVLTSRLGLHQSDNHGTDTDKKDRICVAGWEDPSVRWMARMLQVGPYHTDQDCIETVMLNEDVTAASSTDAKYVLLCLEMETIDTSADSLENLFQAVRHTLSSQVRVCCALVGAEDEYKASLHKIYARYPEMRWLAYRHHVTMVNLNINLADQRIDGYTREGLRNWLVHKAPSLKDDPEEMMDYSDIIKIVRREAKRHVPELITVIRLLAMSLAGTVWVLLTVIALIAITGEGGLQTDVQTATDSLASRISRQRTGKAEWGWRTNAAALTGLQLYHRSWCFDSLENQRSVDRMEIGLLAAISRSREPVSREVTLVQLASHVTALLATYQNPRDFYGHDLVTSLETYVIHRLPFLPQNNYAHSLAVIALYNAGVLIERRHVERLLTTQRPDGSSLYGPDEVAMAAMALACGSQIPEVEAAMRRAVTFLISKRKPDGSYGNVYTTALTMQALNATNTHLGPRDHEKTARFLISRLQREPSLRSLEVAAHVLIAVSGRTLLDVRYFSARLLEKNAVALRTPLPLYLKVVDDDDEIVLETENVSAPYDVRHDSTLLEDHADTRLRSPNGTRSDLDLKDEHENDPVDSDSGGEMEGQADSAEDKEETEQGVKS